MIFFFIWTLVLAPYIGKYLEILSFYHNCVKPWLVKSEWTHAIGRWGTHLWPVPRPLRRRHNGHDGVSNHQPHYCLLNRLFGCRLNKTSKLRVTGLRAGNSPGTGEFHAQMASKAENVSIWWRHHEHNEIKSNKTTTMSCGINSML